MRTKTFLYFTPLIPGSPSEGINQIVQIPAYVTNLSDTHTAAWEGSVDMGRADAKYRYQEKQRSISLDFYMTVETQQEMISTRAKLNSIIALTYPTYKISQGFNGVFTNLRLGQYLNVTGFIPSITWNVTGDTPWTGIVNTSTQQPVYYDVNLQFTVVGEYGQSYRTPLEPPIVSTPPYDIAEF